MVNSHGHFVWYELMTTDMKAARAFYAEVVGWGTQDASVVLTVGGEQSGSIDVPAGGTVNLGPDADESVDLAAVPGIPGSKLEVTVTSDVSGAATVQVPVLDGTLPEYADLVP